MVNAIIMTDDSLSNAQNACDLYELGSETESYPNTIISFYYDTAYNYAGVACQLYSEADVETSTAYSKAAGVSFSSVYVNNNGTIQMLNSADYEVTSLSRSDLRTALAVSNISNTADANLPISTAQQDALDLLVDTASGMGLSSNDYTDDEQEKLLALDIKNKGYYSSEDDLLTAYPNSDSTNNTATTGSYAYVEGTDSNGDAVTYIYSYSATDLLWSQGTQMSSATLSGSDIKTLYTGQSDTNVFTDAEEEKLSGIESGAQANAVLTVNETNPDADGNIALTSSTFGLSAYDGTTPDTLSLNTTQTKAVKEIVGESSDAQLRMMITKSLSDIEFQPLKGGSLFIQTNEGSFSWRVKNKYSEKIAIVRSAYYEDQPTTAWDSAFYEQPGPNDDTSIWANRISSWFKMQYDQGGAYEVQKGNHCNLDFIDLTHNMAYDIDIYGLTNHRFIISCKVSTAVVLN